jgi:hypothetical protein
MGSFVNDEFGSYTRYSYTAPDAELIIKLSDSVLVIGAKTSQETSDMYNEIKQHVSVN